jgi:hypothetical protein
MTTIKQILADLMLFILVFSPIELFAQTHHQTDAWGIGVHGRDNFTWNKMESFGGPGISLKPQKIPVFWDVSLGLKDNHWFNVGVSGDYYFLDKTFVDEINLGWFLGVGAYVGFTSSGANENEWSKFGGGIRAPIGLSWIFKENLEVFGAWIPSLGTDFWKSSGAPADKDFGSLTFEAGVRYWFVIR